MIGSRLAEVSLPVAQLLPKSLLPGVKAGMNNSHDSIVTQTLEMSC